MLPHGYYRLYLLSIEEEITVVEGMISDISSRRRFLKHIGVVGLATAWPSSVLARSSDSIATAHVRVEGIVRCGGQPLSNVRVTDGLQVTRTDTAGHYLLHTTTQRLFIYLSVPRGCKIPQSEVGTASFYRPIDEAGTMRADFNLRPLDFDDVNHSLIVFADPQTKDRYEVDRLHSETLPDVIETVSEVGAERLVGITCGDIMGGDLGLLPEYKRFTKDVGIPMYQVVGNHDIVRPSRSDEASLSTFRSNFGPRHYSFDRGDVRYIVLDNVFWTGRSYFGYVDETQLQWLQNDLADLEAGRTVVLFMHIPMSSTLFERLDQETPDFARMSNDTVLKEMLAPYQAHVISGHIHEHEHLISDGLHEHILGTVCGAWWSGDICYDGTPNGYAIYDVRGSAVSWRYKSTGYPIEYQMRASEKKSLGDRTELTMNVWDADDEWTVVWYEDGIRSGRMCRVTGTDGRAEELYRGEGVPERRPSLEPVPTNHLYNAQVANKARIRVEAIDRFGRTYNGAVG